MRNKLLFLIIFMLFFLGGVSAYNFYFYKREFSRYKLLVESNRPEVVYMQKTLYHKGYFSNFDRSDDAVEIIEKGEFSRQFPVFYENGFRTMFLFRNSGCAIISDGENIAKELLMCKRPINELSKKSSEVADKVIGEFIFDNNEYWYYLRYYYM